MDWSGIYLSTEFSLPAAQTGLAYSFFAGLMVLGRFSGHLIVNQLGERNTILLSALLATTGLLTVVFAPVWQVVLVGYAILGLGSANIVPLMFSVPDVKNLGFTCSIVLCIGICLYRFIDWTSIGRIWQ